MDTVVTLKGNLFLLWSVFFSISSYTVFLLLIKPRILVAKLLHQWICLPLSFSVFLRIPIYLIIGIFPSTLPLYLLASFRRENEFVVFLRSWGGGEGLGAKIPILWSITIPSIIRYYAIHFTHIYLTII